MNRTLRLKTGKDLIIEIDEVTGIAQLHMSVKPMPTVDDAMNIVNNSLTEDGVDDTTRQAIMTNIYNVIDNELVIRSLKKFMVTD